MSQSELAHELLDQLCAESKKPYERAIASVVKDYVNQSAELSQTQWKKVKNNIYRQSINSEEIQEDKVMALATYINSCK